MSPPSIPTTSRPGLVHLDRERLRVLDLGAATERAPLLIGLAAVLAGVDAWKPCVGDVQDRVSRSAVGVRWVCVHFHGVHAPPERAPERGAREREPAIGIGRAVAHPVVDGDEEPPVGKRRARRQVGGVEGPPALAGAPGVVEGDGGVDVAAIGGAAEPAAAGVERRAGAGRGAHRRCERALVRVIHVATGEGLGALGVRPRPPPVAGDLDGGGPTTDAAEQRAVGEGLEPVARSVVHPRPRPVALVAGRRRSPS